MNRRDLLMFTLGAAIGACAMGMYLTEKEARRLEEEERELQEDIRRGKEVHKKFEEGGPYHDFGRPEQDSEVEEEKKVLVMNKDRYKKMTTNYSNTVDLDDVVSNTRKRHSPNPYVIDFERFCEEHENEKITITYYEGDDTLVDEKEEIIPDVSSIIGYEALNNFGRGSEDPDVVYVRNDKMGIDYEVVRNQGNYKEVILGESE